MLRISNRSEYLRNIEHIKKGLKRPYLRRFIAKYWGTGLKTEEYLKLQFAIKNYLAGKSYVSGFELGLNEKIVEFYNEQQ